MNNERSEEVQSFFDGTAFVVMIILFCIFVAGFWVGTQTIKEPEEIYVFESYQPVRAIFDTKLPDSDELESFTVTKGYGDKRREFIFYYWVESNTVDGSLRKQLHWTWREVTGP